MTAVAGLGEARLLELIQPYLSKQAGGDDAAVLGPVDAFQVLSTDTSVQGVHFDLSWMSAEDAGWRALALALGDLAAKGATPAWALVSLAMPRQWKVDDFVGLFKGMHELASKIGMQIEGGDMSAIEGPAVLSLTVAGHTQIEPLPRRSVRPGWAVGVTGPLGASAVALRERRVLRTEPLIEAGRRLNQWGLCCGDISDGLVRDLEKFAQMARIGFRLDASRVPVADGASLDDALTSGEEVQLLCVGPEERVRDAGLEPIGAMKERGFTILGVDGAPHGYDHFA
jgi:thiamine-monophosphate kinase